MSGEKAKYRVLRLSHIHNNLWPEGSEIEYDGEPGSALEPLNDAAKAAKEKAGKKPFTVTAKPVIQNDCDSGGDDGDSGAASEDLASLRQQYEDLFNKKPGNKTAETLKKEIADERQKLGL